MPCSPCEGSQMDEKNQPIESPNGEQIVKWEATTFQYMTKLCQFLANDFSAPMSVFGILISREGGFSTPHPPWQICRGFFGINIPTHPPSQEGSSGESMCFKTYLYTHPPPQRGSGWELSQIDSNKYSKMFTFSFL